MKDSPSQGSARRRNVGENDVETGLPWFSTKGQIVQTACAVFAAIILGVNQWPALRESEYFAPGVILFYAVCVVAGTSLLVLRRTASWLKVALSLLTAAGLGAAAWAYFVTPERDPIRVVGYGSAPLVVGKKVVMNLGLFSPDRKKVVGIYTVRYVDRVPGSIYERKGLEDGIWQDFTSKNLGPGIAITVLGGQPVTVEQSSELPASEYVVEHLLKYGAAVYLMGRFHTEGRSQERQYCVYALYNPPRIGVCVEHN